SHFTIEHLPEAVFWIDADGKIIQTNKAASMLCGYSKEELLKMTVFDFNPLMTLQKWKPHWENTKANKSVTFESTHRHKEGHEYRVEITNNFIKVKGTEYSCSIVRDISKKKIEEDLLRTISEQTAGITGG